MKDISTKNQLPQSNKPSKSAKLKLTLMIVTLQGGDNWFPLFMAKYFFFLKMSLYYYGKVAQWSIILFLPGQPQTCRVDTIFCNDKFQGKKGKNWMFKYEREEVRKIKNIMKNFTLLECEYLHSTLSKILFPIERWAVPGLLGPIRS